jgi:hypothetical protein
MKTRFSACADTAPKSTDIAAHAAIAKRINPPPAVFVTSRPVCRNDRFAELAQPIRPYPDRVKE